MTLLNQIKDKINKKINPENIELIDNSFLHFKHKETDFDRTNPGSSATIYNTQQFYNLGGVSVDFGCGNTENLS